MRNRVPAFGLLLALTLWVLSGCGRATELPTRVAPAVPISTLTPSDSIDAGDPLAEAARDAALAYLRGHHPGEAPAVDLHWTVESTTPEGMVGSQSYRYIGGDWVITVNYPVVAPEATIYDVSVVNPATGFKWEGSLDHEGQVVGLGVNLVTEAGLDRAVEIDLYEMVGEQRANRAMVTDLQIIARVVAALNADVPLGPRAGVPVPYLLEFRLEDGTLQSFGYAPGAGQPAILRGEQGFWQGQDGQPSSAFEALMGELLATTVQTLPDPANARDAALVYLTRTYGGQAPPTGMVWAEETATPQGLVGSSSYRYTAGGWEITVTFPLVAPEATVHEVVVSNPATGFNWEGQVDAQGNVTEGSGPPAPVTPSPPPPTVAAQTPEPPAGLESARDAVLAYLSTVYGNQAPPPGLAWTEEDVTPPGTAGSFSRRYAAGNWQVTVSAPLAAPESTIYHVIVSNSATGFYWEGDVDASMRVNAAYKRAVDALRAVVTYLGQRYGHQLPVPGMGWAEKKIASDPGQAKFEYRFQDWVMTISYPTVDPVELLFEIEVANQATGFRWTGKVDVAGQVTEG